MGEDLLELTYNGLYINLIHLRDGLFRGLLCRLVSNACAPHAVDGGDERDFLSHHRRCVDRGCGRWFTDRQMAWADRRGLGQREYLWRFCGNGADAGDV